MTTARPHLQRYRDAAMDAARVARFRKAVLRVIVGGGVWAVVFLAGRYMPRQMRLPKPHTVVIAYTHDGIHLAYLDSAFDFRCANSGERIGQVVLWQRPEYR